MSGNDLIEVSSNASNGNHGKLDHSKQIISQAIDDVNARSINPPPVNSYTAHSFYADDDEWSNIS